jgi:hypothetical protein
MFLVLFNFQKTVFPPLAGFCDVVRISLTINEVTMLIEILDDVVESPLETTP